MIFRSFLVLFLLVGTAGWSQVETGIMTMTGVGEVTVVPDMATITLGVEVEAPTADRALRLNSARMGEIFKVLKARGIDKRDIQTSQLSLHPQWANQSQSYDQPLKIAGFLATNLVSVKIRNIDLLGSALDSLTKSGANRIRDIGMGIQNPKPHIAEARKRAITDAIEKANLYAGAANVGVGAIISISESGARAQPAQHFGAAALSREAVPVAEGELTLSASVTVQFRIIP